MYAAQLVSLQTICCWRWLQVVPGPLSARHSSVQGIPSSVTAGVPADFAIIPSDQYGNRGAAGGQSPVKMHGVPKIRQS